jgi:hypothetical protein
MKNPPQVPRRSWLTAVSILTLHASLQSAWAAVFTGTDGNWHAATNWNPPGVPDAATDVEVPAGVRVVIDPAVAPGGAGAVARDVVVGSGASLLLASGGRLDYAKLTVDGGSVFARSAVLAGGEMELKGATGAQVWLNPTSNDSRAIKISANNPAKHTMGFVLAGNTRASAAGTGAGHYATMTVESAELADRLVVQTVGGFVPAPGDAFTLIRATRSVSGTFAGLPEGAVAARFPGVNLRISYLGGPSRADVTLVAEAATLPPMPVFDEDGDGVSDVWQALYGVGPISRDADSDGDGVSDWNEYLAGTDPHNPASRFAIGGFRETGDGSVLWGRVDFEAQAGKMYLLEAAPGLAAGDWAGTGMWILAENSGPLSLEIPVRPFPGKGFFRLAVRDVDRDDDGLTAWEEGVVGTSDLTTAGGGGATGGDRAAATGWLADSSSGVDPSGPQANLREVDVAWVRIEKSTGPATGDLVTATGTGQWHHLTSWRLDENISPNPVAMRTTLPIPGGRSSVHFLNPGPADVAPRFLSGSIASNGNLWLAVRGLTGTGAFAHYSTNGFGGNVPVRVKSYAMAHRAFLTEMSVSRYVVVTPLVAITSGGFRHLRIVTWRVDAQSGKITGVSDSGSLGAQAMATLDEDVRLTVTHAGANRYVAGFRNTAGGLSHLRFQTDNDGELLMASIQSSPFVQNIRLAGNLSLPNQAAVYLPLSNNGGHMAAVREVDGGIRVATMESLNPDGSAPGVEVGTLLADSTMDLAPLLNGVVQNPPVLTNSSRAVDRTGEAAGFATVAGDFNGDERADLATSAWRRDVGEVAQAGRVYVIPSGPGGLHNQTAMLVLEAGANGLAGSPGNEDRFGERLAKGDFNGDGFDDLVIGVPSVNKPTIFDAGAVHIVYGSANGLTTSGNQRIDQASLGRSESNFDRFGAAIVAGDFNGDGFEDLAVASPNRTVAGESFAGAVHVIWGSAGGLVTTGSTLLTKNSFASLGTAAAGDQFGFALAAADFNGDGRDDLAVGIPNHTVGDHSGSGALQVYHGAATGFAVAQAVTQAGFTTGQSIGGTSAVGDQFGFTVSAGDFNGDLLADIAIGVPGKDNGSTEDAGRAHVLYGTATGIGPTGALVLNQPLGNGAAGSRFGERLATGDLDGNGSDELAVFSRGFMNGGRIYLHQGRSVGLAGNAASVLAKGTAWLEGGTPQTAAENAVAGDLFGFSIAMADFNGNGRADLAVGVPSRDNDSTQDCGQLHFFDGTTAPTLITLANDTVWFPNVVEIVRAMVSDLAREDSHGKGAGRIFGSNENLEWRHIASSTKLMTLLLAVEAIEAGLVSLDEQEVEFDEVSGTDGGSNLTIFDLSHNLQQVPDGNGNPVRFFADGDMMPLRLVLAAMMNQSCNRASEAIARHVAEKVNGDKLDFLNMMNDRAKKLGMTETVFGAAAAGAATKPQDMITLLAEGRKHPLWVEFASIGDYTPANYPAAEFCGTNGSGAAKCNGGFRQFMPIGSYPGRVAWKGGNTGFWRQENEANDIPDFPAVPWATTSAFGIVRRLGRTMGVGLMQTNDSVNDSGRLFDYAFRQVFIPDQRALTEYPKPGGIDVIVGPDGPIRVRDFAIDHVFHGYGVTAIIDDHEDLRLNIWGLDAAENTIEPLGHASRKYALLGNSGYREPSLIAGSPAQATGRRSDFFTANLIGERLTLQLWRVGDAP